MTNATLMGKTAFCAVSAVALALAAGCVKNGLSPAEADAGAVGGGKGCAAARENPNDDPRAWTMLNMDADYYENTQPDSAMTREAMDRHIGQRLDGGKVTHLFVNPNCMVADYPTKVKGWDRTWDRKPWLNYDPMSRDCRRRQKELAEKGIDRYAEFLKAARKRGVEGWISMRMNDIHGVGDYDSQICEFWHSHPEYWRCPETFGKERAPWPSRAFDYSHKEVREHHIALAEEMLERWDMDGFDADWTRFGHDLAPGREVENTWCLTEVMRAIRRKALEMEKRRGHRIFVSVSTVSTIESALSTGHDIVAWAKEGLVDVVYVANFWTTIYFDTPYADWLRRIREVNPRVRVCFRSDDAVQNYECLRLDLREDGYRGLWDNLMSQGCRDFGFFNLFEFGSWRQKTVCDVGITPALVYDGSPRTYYVTYLDVVGTGFDNRKQLPLKLDRAGKLTLYVGTAKDADRVELTFACRRALKDAMVPTLNGVPALEAARTVSDVVWFTHSRYPDVKASNCSYRADFPASALKAGVNEIGFPSAKGVVVSGQHLTVFPKKR